MIPLTSIITNRDGQWWAAVSLSQNKRCIKAAVAAFEPENNAVILDGCCVVKYNRMIVCPGLKLDWNKIKGLVDSLGQNGVTSNSRYDLAPYTWHSCRE